MAEVRQNGQVYPPSSSSRVKLSWILLVAFVGLSLTAYCYRYSSGIAQVQPLPQQKEYTTTKNFKPPAELQSSQKMSKSLAAHEKASFNKENERFASYNSQTESSNDGGNGGNDDNPTYANEGKDYSSDDMMSIEPNTGSYQFSEGKFGVVYSQPVTDDLEMEKFGTKQESADYGSNYNPNGMVTTNMIMKRIIGVSGEIKPVTMNGSLSSDEIKTYSKSKLGNDSRPTADSYRTRIYKNFIMLADTSKPHCNITSQFNSWKKGVVTQMGLPIKYNCRKLFFRLQSELMSVQAQVNNWRSQHPWENFAKKFTGSCDIIREEFSNSFYVSPVEKNFPIAYILIVYSNAGQVIRLLKAIYRPQNTYCIHPDARQGTEFSGIFQAISRCLDNVFVVSRPISVYYGHHTIMDAQLNCMDDLMKRPKGSWKYVINLCGREVPLKTNREIVESLTKLKGYSAVLSSNLTSNAVRRRFAYKYKLWKDGLMHVTSKLQKKAPFGIKIYKSMNFLAGSYAFVEFILNDDRAKALSNYLRTAYAPEEHFYASLYELPDARGAKPKEDTIAYIDIPEIDRYIWIISNYQKSHASKLCPGKKIVHRICILTAPDMEHVVDAVKARRPTFFFNKYFLEWDPTVVDCMEEKLVGANMEEYWKDCVQETTNLTFQYNWTLDL